MRYLIETLIERKKDYLGKVTKTVIRKHTIKAYDLSDDNAIQLEQFLLKQLERNNE